MLGFDEIDLSAIDANTNASGKNYAFTFRGKDAFAGAGSLISRKFKNAGTSIDRTIVCAEVNGEGRYDSHIGRTGLKTLAASDFVL